MRQIKFRAWDGCRMLCEEDFYIRHGFAYEFMDFGLRKTNWTLMQFTGLTDKNGIDIYEGDIVKTRYTSNTPKVGQVYSQPFRLNWSVKHSSLANQDLFAYSRPDCSVEVIGNIHENPELLTK